MAACHARAFAGQVRSWSTDEFASLLQSPHVFFVGDEHSFALGRTIAGEAELLTLVTDPAQQRLGRGLKSLLAFEDAARKRHSETCFLEVAADNGAATALYRQVGFEDIARRAEYYQKLSGQKVDAIIFQKRLSPAH